MSPHINSDPVDPFLRLARTGAAAETALAQPPQTVSGQNPKDAVPFQLRIRGLERFSPAEFKAKTGADNAFGLHLRGLVRKTSKEVPATEQVAVAPLEPVFHLPYPRWKRALDIAGATAGLAVFAPLMAAIALAVKLDSKGPATFCQKRGGHGGKPFTLYKFRTMVIDAEAQKAALRKFNERSGPVFKMKNDPRITRLGRFLRKTSLDELPQLLNVIKGDMGLVGPRPLPVEEDRGYEQWQRARLDVKPGLTCFWQVTSRDESCFDSWVRLDLKYVRKHSFWTDFKLILQTIPAVLMRKGAH